tara:strand:- start:175 stop:747 length:573 start_codon:yes stop_codon:yes gene_type:complete
MKFLFLLLIFTLLNGCNKPKTIMICGDHECINKKEARHYFEENLTLEVKIVNKKIDKEIDLIELNLKESSDGKKEIKVFSKSKTNNKLKTLSNDEIKKIRKKIKDKENKKITKKSNFKEKKEKIKQVKKVKKIDKNQKTKTKTNKFDVNKKRNEVVDVCTIIEKCSIEEISKYLLNEGKKRGFPDITSRQ